MRHADGEPTPISKRRWWLLLAAWGLYGLMFLPLYHRVNGAAIALAFVPALFTSWTWGVTGGGLAALLTLPLNLALLFVSGRSSGHALSGEGLVIWGVTVAAAVFGGWLSRATSRREPLAAERRQIDGTLQRQNLHLRNLLQTAEMLASTLRFEPLLDQTLDQLQKIAPYDAASVVLVRDTWAQVVQCRGWHPATERQRVSLEEHPWINRVVNDRCPVVLSPAKEGLGVPMEAGGAPLKSWLGVPLTARNRVIGVLTLASGTQVYNESNVRLVTAFAHQTALALENSRLYEQTRSQLREVTALQGVTSAISSTLDVEQILPYVARSLCRMLNSTSVEIYSLGKDGSVGTAAASYATEAAEGEEKRLPLTRHETWHDDPFTARALREQRPLEARLEDPDLPAATRAKLQARRAKAALLLPIVSRDRVLGYAYVWDSSSSRSFTEGEIATGQTLIRQTATAVENARLIGESQRRANHLAAAADVARRVAAISDPASLLDAVVDLIEERFRFRLAAVLLVNEVEQYLYPGAATDDFWDVIPDSYRQPIGKGAIGTAAQTGEVVSIPDTSKNDTAYRVGNWFSPSSLSVPIKMGGLVIGVLQVEADVPNAFDESDQVALQVIADQIAIAHQNAELLTETRSRVKDLQLLHDVSLAAASSTHLKETLQAAAEALAAGWDGTQIALQLVDEQAGVLRMMAGVGYVLDGSQNLDLPLGEGVTGWVAERGEPVLISDVREDPRYYAANPDIRSELCVPLNAGSGVLGTLNVESYKVDAFTLDDQRLLTTLGSNLAMLIERARLFEQVEEARAELQQRADDLEQANRRLKELDRLKSQFLANMSHELRTPLNSVIGFSEVLIDGLLGDMPPERKECVENIYASGEHLMALINDVLDLSKIEAGRVELALDDFAVTELIGNVEKTVTPMIAEKSQELVLDVADDLPPLSADRVRVRQILLNLLSNAHKFAPEGSKITLSCRLADSNTMLFSVVDTGIGIKAKDQQLIFEEFRQADGSTTREAEGTGLGLTISKRLVELHRGAIWVESNYGEGATFSFLLPLSGPSSPVDAGESGVTGTYSEPGVLIVEDDHSFGQLLSVYLRREGFCPTLYDAKVGIVEQARQLAPVLIILDVTFGGRDGWKLLENLRSSPHTVDFPVLAIATQPQSHAARTLGVADFLFKPLSRDTVERTLSHVLGVQAERCGLTVLAIDESHELAQWLETAFPQAPHTFIPARGLGARSVLDDTDAPDVVLLDLQGLSPDRSQTLKDLGHNQQTSGVPIVAVVQRGLASENKMPLEEFLSGSNDSNGLTPQALARQIAGMRRDDPATSFSYLWSRQRKGSRAY